MKSGILIPVLLFTAFSQPAMVFGQTEGEVSPGFTEVLTAQEIERFGDYTVEEALARIPGIQVDRRGNISVRGGGFERFYVTVNGQRMGTTGLGNRGADLSAISVDVISKIEVKKVLTPDMHADGLTGVINLITKKPRNEEIVVTGRLSGGVSPEYVEHTGPTGRATIDVAGKVADKLYLNSNLNFQHRQRATEVLGMGYGVQNFGNGNVDVLETLSPGLQTQAVNRLGANLNLDFDYSENTRFYLNSMLNTNYLDQGLNQNSWRANGSWEDATTTGPQAMFNHHLGYQENNITQYTVKAGGEHDFDNLKLSYHAGWGRSINQNDTYFFPFIATGVQFQVNRNDVFRPEASFMDPSNAPLPEDLNLREMNYVINHQYDEKITGQIDLEIPIQNGAVKFGGSAMLSEKDAMNRGAFSDYHYTYQGFLNLDGFEEMEAGGRSVFEGKYELDRMLDGQNAVSFFQSSIPNMRLDAAAYYEDSEIYNFLATENIYAGYGMVDYDLGDIHLTAGLRAEFTDAEYDARTVAFTPFETYINSGDTSATNSYLNLLPHAQANWQLQENLSVHLAYSRSLARPVFNAVSPFEMTTPADTSIFVGNEELDPISSDNIDLRVNVGVNEDGMISVGGFYKNINNYIVSTSETFQLQEGRYSNFSNYFDDEVTEIPATRRSYANSDETATLYGVEVAVDQQFSFLPGALSNFGVNANYTWSQSKFDTGAGETAMPAQSPHALNAALRYLSSGLRAQVSYHWSAEMLQAKAGGQTAAPALGSQVYLDQYVDGYQQLMAHLSYNFTDALRAEANFYDLISVDQASYLHTRDVYPTSVYTRNGFAFTVGVQYQF